MFYILTTRFQDWLDAMGLYSVIQVFTQLEFRALAAGLFAFLVVILLGPRTIARLRQLKVGDNPEFYNTELNALNQPKKDTPTMGGLLIVGSILASLFLFSDFVHSRYVHLSVLVLVWLAGVGAFDDWLKLTAARRAAGTREGLFAWEKFLFQMGCAILVSLFLFHAADPQANPAAVSLNLPFQRTYEPVRSGDIAGAVLNPNVFVLGIFVYALVCIFATRMDSISEFFAMAVVIGLVQGGVQALSRSFFARLIPAEKGGEYFGFYNMVGKFAAILGPTLMGVSALVVGTRISILSLLLLFGGGLWLLTKVKEPVAARRH